MCGIENMYLCNCIVCLMANSFLEEKKVIYMFVLIVFCFCFFFVRGECKFCVLPVWFLSDETSFSFRTAKRGILLTENRSIGVPVLAVLLNWFLYGKKHTKKPNCKLNLTYRANCNSLVLNWLQEQSARHIHVMTSSLTHVFYVTFHRFSTSID